MRALQIREQQLRTDHPATRTTRSNFITLVQQASEAGQADKFSEPPTTQDMLQQIREQ